MSKERRKLIFVWAYLEWGGAQIYFLGIMKVARPDWDILVVLPRNSLPEMLGYLDDLGVSYEFIDASVDSAPAPTLFRKLQRQARRIKAEWAAFRFLKKLNLHNAVVHAEFAPWQSWQLLWALSRRCAGVFVTLHNALPRSAAWRESVWKTRMLFLSRLSRFHIFTSNKDTKGKFRGWVTDEFWHKINVTYTCVNPPEIEEARTEGASRSEIRKGLGLTDNEVIVLCVGQFVDRKGRWIFLEAAKLIAEARSDIKFVWLTPQMPSDEDRIRIDRFGLGDRFRLVLSETVGTKRVEVLRFFRIADIFTLASLVEGLPIALLEAMAMGLPSVSTRINAIPEAIMHNQTGLLVEPNNALQLASAIVTLADDRALRKRIADEGQQFVLGNFDERIASQIAIDAYGECFANGE